MALARLIDLYCLVIAAAVVVSWTDLPRDHPAVRFLDAVTEPVLKPVRSILPPVGGVDLTPIAVIVVLQLLAGIF